MRLQVNGDMLETEAKTVAELLSELGITSGMVAVEVDLNIVKKKDYAVYALKEGDVIEIVNFVGGG